MKSTVIRRLILVLSILISGGSFIFPRTAFLLIILVLCFVTEGKLFVFRKQIIPVVFLLALLLFLSVFIHSGFDLSSFVIRFSVFIITLFIFNFYIDIPIDVFQKDLFVILRILPYQAIVTVILATITPFLFLTIELSNSTYQTIGMVFTYHTTIEDYAGLKRPDGFFYEPGVYHIYLNIFLYLCLFVYNKKWESLITIVAIFLTQSTTGLLICLMLIGYYVVIVFVNKGPAWFRVIKFFIGSLFLIPVVILAVNNINEKLYGDFKGSAWARQYDLLTGVNIIATKPFTGIGFDYAQYRRMAGVLGYDGDFFSADAESAGTNTDSISDRGTSNGIVFLLYSIGMLFGGLFIIGMFQQSFFKHRGLIGMILFLSFLSESIIFTPFFLLLIYSGISRIFFKRKYTGQPNLNIT